MCNEPALTHSDRAQVLNGLRASIAFVADSGVAPLSFGVDELDSRLGAGGIDAAGLHEITAASPTLGDDAAASLFVAGLAARFAATPGANVAWALTRFDLYAPGLEQAGLPAAKLLYVQGKNETMTLALAEDSLREGSFAAVVAEVKVADQTATRRLQLAAANGRTPMLLLRRWAKTGRDPLERPFAGMTRWRIGCAPSMPLPAPGVGRACWSVELVRQRNGNPFSLMLEACDETGRLAIAGTPGAAHALARYGGREVLVVDRGAEAAALADLPIAALRLEPAALTAAARFGLERIVDLIRVPRGPLARRLGLAAVTRLDQALGHATEPIIGVVPFEAPQVSRHLLEPIGTPESITQVIGDLIDDLIVVLRQRGLGLRSGVLVADRVDGEAQRIALGASRATRDAKHLKRMFALKLDRIEPGLGIEAMHLLVPHSEPLGASILGALVASEGAAADLAPAIDQLVGRAGEAAVFRVAPNESDVPERAIRRVGPLSEPGIWPKWKRPVRILRRPEHLTHVVALLPDHPPRRFTWRAKRYRVVAGDGPERIHGEWWRSDCELWAVRDYFRVEVEGGERFWLFRRGDGVEPETGDLSWYIHGIFG